MNLAFKTTINYLKRSPFQALAAILVMGLTFFVATLISIAIYSSGKLLNYLETTPQVIVFLKNDPNENAISNLRSALENDNRIKDLRFVSKEEALNIYKKATSDNPLLGELVSPSIFPASLEFSVKNLSDTLPIIEEVKKEPVVESVGFTANLSGEKSLGEVIQRLKEITVYIRVGGAGFALFLAGISFLVLTVVISMRLNSRKEEIEILELIGATGAFIKTPIVLESITYAIFGVITGWIFAVILLLYSTPTILIYFGKIPILPSNALALFGLLGIILLGELIVGIIIAILGSLIAIGRASARR
ncbi:MAG: permease-like cell division protein FtsX [Patescibacteria group bacterium]